MITPRSPVVNSAYHVYTDLLVSCVLQVVGSSRLPCLEDRDKMPYTLATINEIYRLSCVATAVPRCTTVDTTLGGYTIPKDTNVICNLW